MNTRAKTLRQIGADTFAALEQAANDVEAASKAVNEAIDMVEASPTLDEEERFHIVKKLQSVPGVK